MKDFDISVVVPFYNAGNLFEKFLHSVFSQEKKNVEFIFINDASTDNSLKILSETLDKFPHIKENVKVFQNKENSGTGFTRNLGMSKISGKYFIQLDADDWVEKNMFSNMFDLAEETQADVVATDYFMSYPNKEVYIKQNYSENAEKDFKSILLGNLQGSFWNKLIKTEFYRSNGINISEEFSLFEDKLFCLKIFSRAKKISYLPKAFVHYRQHQNSMTSVYVSDKHVLDTKKFIQELKLFLENENLFEKYQFDFFTTIQYHKKIFLLDKKYFSEWDDYYPEVNKIKYTLNIQFYTLSKKIITILALLGWKSIMLSMYNLNRKKIAN